MSNARKLSLAAAAALAVAAFAAPSALGAVEVKTEPGGVHCGNIVTNNHVVMGGCPFHVASIENIVLLEHNAEHSAEQALFSCTMEFEGRINEAGTGRFYNQVLNDVMSGSCPIEPCKEGGDGATETWPFQIQEVGGTELIEVGFCFQQGAVEGVTCTVHMPFTTVGHVYGLNAEPGVGCEAVGDEREINGRWRTENAGEAGHTNIEVVHA